MNKNLIEQIKSNTEPENYWMTNAWWS